MTPLGRTALMAVAGLGLFLWTGDLAVWWATGVAVFIVGASALVHE